MIGRGIALSIGLLLVGSAARSVAAQDFQVASRGPKFVAAAGGRQLTPEANEFAVLRRRVTLALDAVPLGQALEAIVKQAGLEITYSPAVVPTTRPISLHAQDITVAAALTEILLDLNIDVSVARNGHLALIGRPGAAHWGPAGSMTGRVTDAKTGVAVAGTEVWLSGTRWRALADTSGWYRLDEVDAGSYTLNARRIGYAKYQQAVTIASGREDTVSIALEPQATRLDELVTTATGERRRLQVPSDITRLDADSIMRTQPVKSVTEILEGRVPGLVVQHTSGAPGDPSRLRLRGASSPSLNNDPIVVVDGIRVYSQQSDLRSSNLADFSTGLRTDPGHPPSKSEGDYATPSPLDYIDPNSIETIEVVKGASATTLYGQDAANGVIVITTKKGKAGPARWTVDIDHGMTAMAEQYPERVLRWGHALYSGASVPCPLGNIAGSSANRAPQVCVPDSLVHFQLLNEPDLTPLGHGQRTATSLTVSGGVRSLTYNVIGSYSHDLGLIRLPDYEAARYETRLSQAAPDWMRRPQAFTQWGVTSTLGAQLGPKADLSFRTSLGQTDQRRSSLERQLGSLDAMYLDRASGRYYATNALDFIQSGFIGFKDHALDDYYTQATAAATTVTAGASLNWRPWSWLTTTADAGINVEQRNDRIFLPRGAATGVDSVGVLSNGEGRSLVHTLNLRATAIRPLSGFTLRLSSGVNYTSNSIQDFGSRTRHLPLGQVVPGDTILVPYQGVSDVATFGWYVEPALDHGRFSLVSGLRLDGGSSYGGKITLPTFPKLGGTWTLSEEPFFPFKSIFSSFRVRAAYGRASRQPGPTERLRLYSAPDKAFVDGEFVGASALQTLGNTQLRPERTSELEGGFDADLLNSRVTITVTGYRKTTDDALMPAQLPPSVYGNGVQITRNIGVTRNTGLDVVLGATLVRSTPLTWRTDLAVSHRRDELVRLGPGVEPFYIAGSDQDVNGGQRVAPGYPLFGYWARPVVGYADLDGNGIIGPSEVVVGDTAVYRGAQLPDYSTTLSSSVGLWQGAVQLTMTLLYDKGMTQHPSGDLTERDVGLSAGVNDPASSPADQALASSFARTRYYWYQQVSATRLKALTVSYTVPQSLARRVGAERLSIALQGANLGVWSNYRGVDPNVNTASTGNITVDGGALPQPRTWQVRVNATY